MKITTEMARRYIAPLEPLPVDALPSGGPAFPVDCFLFDVYGTLFISASGDIGLAEKSRHPLKKMESLLKRYQLKVDAQDLGPAFRREVALVHARKHREGIHWPEVVVEEVWQALLSLQEVDTARRFALEYELLTNPVWPMPGLQALLAAIRGAGIPMGIISNAQFYTPLLFDWFCSTDPEGLGFDPDLVCFSYRMGEAKPSPRLFNTIREALDKRGLAPQRTLYLGNDMAKDVLPASRAGFRTALFAGDRRSLRLHADDPQYRDLAPDLVIRELEDLTALITPRC